MKTTRRETEIRYLNFLKEVRTALRYTDNISMREFMVKHRVSKNTSKAMIDGRIISTNNIRGKGCKYNWTTIEPNLEMAIKLLENTNTIQRSIVEKAKNKKTEPKKRGGKRQNAGRKPLKQEVKRFKTKKISIAWGLINIEY